MTGGDVLTGNLMRRSVRCVATRYDSVRASRRTYHRFSNSSSSAGHSFEDGSPERCQTPLPGARTRAPYLAAYRNQYIHLLSFSFDKRRKKRIKREPLKPQRWNPGGKKTKSPRFRRELNLDDFAYITPHRFEG